MSEDRFQELERRLLAAEQLAMTQLKMMGKLTDRMKEMSDNYLEKMAEIQKGFDALGQTKKDQPN